MILLGNNWDVKMKEVPIYLLLLNAPQNAIC